MSASEKKLLIKFDNNYADEFDVEGFLVLSQQDWEKHQELAKKVFKQKGGEVEVGFGTNEAVSYYSLEDYLSSFDVTEITQEQYQVLWDLFGVHTKEYSYGRGKDKVTIPESFKIESGMLCMIDEDYLEEDEDNED